MRSLKCSGCCLLGLAVLGIVASAVASVPRLIHYQGRLLTSPDDVPVTEPVSLTIRLYDEDPGGGSITFEEAHPSVPLANGLFH